MSAEILMRAAERIRKDQDIEENLGHIGLKEFQAWLAVADWLDSVVAAQYPPGFTPHRDCGRSIAPRDDDAALAVARAYLGEVQP